MKTYKSTIDNYTLVREPTTIPKVKIISSKEAAKYILDNMYDEDIWECESLGIITVNSSNITKGYKIISKGGIDACISDQRLMFKYILDSLATGFILFHNHPSGNPEPSKADIKLYDTCKKIAELFNIRIIDCLVVSPEDDNNMKYYSFADNGIL